MRLNVHAGHNAKVTGTSGNGLYEHVEARKVKDRVISGLLSQGCTVYDTTDEGGATTQIILSNVCSNCMQHKVDKGISIHMNASNGQGYGVEVWCWSENERAEAQRMANTIAVATGLRNRGAKICKGNNELYVVKNVDEPVFLIECFFMDNANDCNIYKSIGSERLGDIIVQAITDKAVEQPTPTPPVTSTGVSQPGGRTGVVTIVCSELNMRKGPSTDYEVVGVLKKGESFIAYGQVNGWHNLGGEQWVSGGSSYVRYVADELPKPSTSTRIGVATTKVNLNVRAGIGGNHTVIRTIPKGESWNVYEKKDGWLKVHDGWISGSKEYVSYRTV